MYGQNRYGTFYYARDSGEETGGEEYFVNLARYVPLFVSELAELAEISFCAVYFCQFCQFCQNWQNWQKYTAQKDMRLER